MEIKRNLYFVHAVDTEGPISESLKILSKDLILFKMDYWPILKPKKLQKKEINCNGLEDAIANCISPKRPVLLKI